jgi:hypothetical protein
MENGARKIIKAETDDNYNDDQFLKNDVIERNYAKTGNITKQQEVEPDKEIQRVGYDDSDFEFTDEEEFQVDENGRAVNNEDEDLEIDDNRSSEQISLDKKVQAKIAKSQSKTITDMYCFILLAAVKHFSKFDENKVLEMDARGELSASQVIAGLPLIQHIKNGNEYVKRLEIDEESRDSIQEALEIYMIAMNIKTSPGLNLAMAMATPAIGLFMEGMSQKKEMKNLVSIALETQQIYIAQNQQLIEEKEFANQKATTLETELENARMIAEAQEKELADFRKKAQAMQTKTVPSKTAKNNLVASKEKNPEVKAKSKPKMNEID